MWLLVLGHIMEGHPGTVVLWIFYAQHCLKRATVIEGLFFSSDYQTPMCSKCFRPTIYHPLLTTSRSHIPNAPSGSPPLAPMHLSPQSLTMSPSYDPVIIIIIGVSSIIITCTDGCFLHCWNGC
jgi:hypothetical protein